MKFTLYVDNGITSECEEIIDFLQENCMHYYKPRSSDFLFDEKTLNAILKDIRKSRVVESIRKHGYPNAYVRNPFTLWDITKIKEYHLCPVKVAAFKAMRAEQKEKMSGQYEGLKLVS